VQRTTITRIFKSATSRWLERDAFQHAGSLAFFTLFSLAPLVIIVVAIVGTVFGEDAASGRISAAISDMVGVQAAKAVEGAVQRSRLEEAGILPTVLGIGALIFGATTVFAQMQSSLNRFWGVRAKPTRSGILNFITVRLLSLSMVLIIGFLMLTSLVVSLAISAVIEHAQDWIPIPGFAVALIDLTVSLSVITVLFGMLFKILPDVYIQWSDVWRGAFITALLFAVGKYLISLYLTHVAPASTYGAAGSLVLVLLWVYYSSLILFFGTCLTISTILERGGDVRPKKTAVRTSIVMEEADGPGRSGDAAPEHSDGIRNS
jgi:membrane protein